MINKRKVNILLLFILAVGFIYRFALMTANTFPPGADIGLHQSVINSILAPKTTFLYNYFHMGGGISATNPGYHIFAAFIISMTGATDYLVQAAVASMFSALIILCIFMVVKLIWGELAGFVAAILALFSASDIIMLCWAGYPNIIALALIPLLFYLFLQPKKLSQKNYLIVASLITGALFLTHLFSAIIFITIAILALIVNLAFSKSKGFTQKTALAWLTPLFFGFILVSPYILSVIPFYFGTEGAITGTVPTMKQAVVETRVIPATILGLALIPIGMFFVFSKRQNKKFFTLPSVLFASALLVPLAAAQGYLFGFFLDYERFLYFLALPVIVCLALIIVKAAEIIPKGLRKIKVKVPVVKAKPVLITAIVIFCLLTPLFTLPYVGETQANFFQVMNQPKYEAIKWIQNNTPENAVIVADASMGWWTSGFAKRATLSAVEPQYLILQREFAPALTASNLLKADYIADNGLLRIQQTGAYANGSSHDIYAILNDSIIEPLVFSINDTQLSLLYRNKGSPEEIKLGTFIDSNTQVVKDNKAASFIISRESDSLRITQEITIYQGMRFAEITFVFQNLADSRFDWLRIPFQSRGQPVQYANSIGMVDNTLHIVNQIVLPNNQLGNDVLLQENADNYELVCNLAGNSTSRISFFVGLCPFNPVEPQTNQTTHYNSLIEDNARTYLDSSADYLVTCFDYKSALRQWNVSYIIVRDPEAIVRFLSDSTFTAVFQNSELTIFKVTKTL